MISYDWPMKTTFLFILFVSVCQVADAQSISQKEFKEEIETSLAFITDVHANPFKYQTKEQLYSRGDSLFVNYATGDSISLLKAYQCYANLVSSIKCAHSGAYKSRELDSTINQFPLQVHTVEQGFIAENHPTFNLQFGDQVISINGVSWKTIMNQGMHLHSSDGYSPLNNEAFQKSLANDIPVIVGNQSHYDLMVVRSTNDTLSLRLKASSESIDQRLSPRFEFSITGPTKNIGLITVHSFPSDVSSIRAFEKFCLKTRNKIKCKKNEHVIIDLRNNGGGDRLDLLLRFFAPKSFAMMASSVLDTTNLSKYRDKIVFQNLTYDQVLQQQSTSEPSGWVDNQGKLYLDVNLYVLTNGRTASAASHFASLVKENKLGKIVGTETGGRASGCNGSVYGSYFLPHSGIEIWLPLVKNTYAVDQISNQNHGVIPDILIEKELSDELQLATLIKLISQ
jgi:C-terminal processing protease CtpA/Prc